MLGACNTCVRLQPRVTSSGTTVSSWMIWFHCFYFYFFRLFCFVGFLLLLLLLLAFVSVCAFKFVLLMSLFWFLFVVFYFILFYYFYLFIFFLSFVSLFLVLETSAVFISMLVGVGWSYNYLLVRKLTFLISELYINLKCHREVWL